MMKVKEKEEGGCEYLCVRVKTSISVNSARNFMNSSAQSAVNALLEQYMSVLQLICALTRELVGEQCENSSLCRRILFQRITL